MARLTDEQRQAKLELRREQLRVREIEAQAKARNSKLALRLAKDDSADIPTITVMRQSKDSLLEYLGGVVEASKAGLCEVKDGIAAARQIAGMEGWETKAVDPVGADDIVKALEDTLDRFNQQKSE